MNLANHVTKHNTNTLVFNPGLCNGGLKIGGSEDTKNNSVRLFGKSLYATKSSIKFKKLFQTKESKLTIILIVKV